MVLRAKGIRVKNVKISHEGEIWANIMPRKVLVNGTEFNSSDLYNKTMLDDAELISAESKSAILEIMTNCIFKSEKKLIEAEIGKEMTADEKAATWQDIYDELTLSFREGYERRLPEEETQEEEK
jgi:hypothetical protein